MNEAVLKAAALAAAKEMYKERCKSVGVKPVAWSKVAADVREGLLAEATRDLQGPPAQPDQHHHHAPAAQVSEAPPAPDASAPPPPPPVLGGAARVEEREEELDDFNPNGYEHVVLDVTRGNLRKPMKVPVTALAPDVTSVMPWVLRFARDSMLQAQQSPAPNGQQPSQPVQPNAEYALRHADGRLWYENDRLRLKDFNESWADDTGKWPSLSVIMVDVQGSARTHMTAAQAPVAPGNPMVIGTEGERGQVLGRPVVGGPQTPGPVQAPPPQFQPDQPAQPGQGHAPYYQPVPAPAAPMGDPGAARLA